MRFGQASGRGAGPRGQGRLGAGDARRLTSRMSRSGMGEVADVDVADVEVADVDVADVDVVDVDVVDVDVEVPDGMETASAIWSPSAILIGKIRLCENIGETNLSRLLRVTTQETCFPRGNVTSSRPCASTANARANLDAVARRADDRPRDRVQVSVTKRDRRFASTNRSTWSSGRPNRSERCVGARCTRRSARRS